MKADSFVFLNLFETRTWTLKPWRWSRWWSRESQCQISESSSTPPLFNSFSDLVLISDNYNYLIIVLINSFTGTGFSIPLCQTLTNHMLLKLSRESQFQIWDNWWLVDSFIKTCFSIYPVPNINQIILFINGHHKFCSVLLTVVIIFCVLYFYWYFTEVLLKFCWTFTALLLNFYWTYTELLLIFAELFLNLILTVVIVFCVLNLFHRGPINTTSKLGVT